MAKNKTSFLLYVDLVHTVGKLSDDQAGKLFKHILSYVNDENPVLNDLILELVFEPIKQQLKRDLKRYEAICLRNKDNGSKGGRPKSKTKKPKKPSGLFTNPNNPDGSRNNPNNPDEPDNDNDNDTDIDYKSIIENYHTLCPKMSKVEKLTGKRQGFVNARFAEFGISKITEVLRRAGESDFLNGVNDRAWKADFEWLMRPENFVKVLEGKYDVVKPAEISRTRFVPSKLLE